MHIAFLESNGRMRRSGCPLAPEVERRLMEDLPYVYYYSMVPIFHFLCLYVSISFSLAQYLTPKKTHPSHLSLLPIKHTNT